MSYADSTGPEGPLSAETTAGRTVTAFFDSRAAAQKAVDDLVAAGFPKQDINIVEGGPEPIEMAAQPSQDKGFWAMLKDLFMPAEDRHSYGEGLRRGGFLLAVRSDAAAHDRIVAILDREGAVDMNERETAWELEGWKPARAGRDLAAERTFSGLDDAAWIGETRPSAPAAATDLGASVPKDELREAYRGSPDVPAAIEPDGVPQDEATPGRGGLRDPNAGRARVRSYFDEGL